MRLTALIIIVAICTSLSAQQESSLDSDSIPNLSITFSPSAFINEFSGIQFGIEKRLSRYWATEIEAAYIFPQGQGSYSSDIGELRKEGVRAKLGLKRRFQKRFYFLLTLYFRHTTHDYGSMFSRFDGQFTQSFDYSVSKSLIGPALGYVWEISIGKKIKVELGGSTGYGKYSIKRSKLPADVELIIPPDERGMFNGFNGFTSDAKEDYPIIAGHLKLKFRVN